MYGYEEFIDITFEQLLQKISQEQIFELVFKQKIDLSCKYTSPFRIDKSAGCFFDYIDNKILTFVDFGEVKGKTHRSCLRAIMDKYNLSTGGAIKFICNKYKLSKNSNDYQEVPISEYSKPEKEETIITYQSKEFSKKDIIYWSKFLIKPGQLIEDGVFSILNFKMITSKKVTNITPFNYCYAIDFIDTVKIYQPLSSKYKWITNCDENDIGNIDNLPEIDNELIISKSYKDHRVLRNLELGLNIIWFQNEGCVPDKYILENLSKRFQVITIFFDNDAPGIKAAKKLQSIFNEIRKDSCRVVYLPRRKYQWKDPAEFINKEGKQDLIKVLKQIGINGTNTFNNT